MRGQAEEQVRVEAAVQRLAFLLGMDWILVQNRFTVKKDEFAAAESSVGDSQYRQHSIQWNLSATATVTDEELEAIVVHELVHALLGTLWDQISAAQQEKLKWFNERATEDVTRAILALLPPRD